MFKCFEMSIYNMLEFIFNEIFYVVNFLREDWEIRMRIIDELRDVVSIIESLRGMVFFYGCRVLVFFFCFSVYILYKMFLGIKELFNFFFFCFL